MRDTVVWRTREHAPISPAHCSDVITRAMASQITGVSIVCLAFCSGADQRKHQSSASLAFVRGIHRWPVDSPHKGPVTRKLFPFDDVIMSILHNDTLLHPSQKSILRYYSSRAVSLYQRNTNCHLSCRPDLTWGRMVRLPGGRGESNCMQEWFLGVVLNYLAIEHGFV